MCKEESFLWLGWVPWPPLNKNSVRGGVTFTSKPWDLPPVPPETSLEAQTPKDLNGNPPFPHVSILNPPKESGLILCFPSSRLSDVSWGFHL